jgi:hypothetical protein
MKNNKKQTQVLDNKGFISGAYEAEEYERVLHDKMTLWWEMEPEESEKHNYSACAVKRKSR